MIVDLELKGEQTSVGGNEKHSELEVTDERVEQWRLRSNGELET